MIAAFSPAESWVLLGALGVAAGLLYWLISRGDDEQMSDEWLERWHRDHPEAR